MLIKLVGTYLFQNSCKSAKILSNLQFKYIYMVFIKAPIGHPPIHTNSSTFICCMNFQNINLIPILSFTYQNKNKFISPNFKAGITKNE